MNFEEAIEVRHIDDLKSIVSSNKEKHCIVYITADWCTVCKRNLPYINEFLKEKDTVNLIADYDTAKTIVHKFKIRAIPTLLRFYEGDIDSICMSGSIHEITKFFNEF